MAAVGIKELKNRLTHYLRQTKKGEEVIVTERGRPIALIQKIESNRKVSTREAQLAKLAAQGFVTLPTRKLVKKIRRIKVGGEPLSKIIIEERR